MKYVCGFAFNEDKSKVALVLKNRPNFLCGKYNGIGGKIDTIDMNDIDAMVREFREETGCNTDSSDWKLLGDLSFSKGIVYFYFCILPNTIFSDIHTVEDEEICIHDVDTVFNLPLDIHAKIFLLAACTDNIDIVNITLNN